MRLGTRWALVLGIACVLVMAAALLSLELALERQRVDEQTRWRDGRVAELSLRLSLLGQEALGRVQVLAASEELHEMLSSADDDAMRREVVDWASSNRGRFELDECLVLRASGEVVTSALEPASYGLPHPTQRALEDAASRNPLLWPGWKGTERPLFVGAARSLRVRGEQYLVAGGLRLESAELAALARQARCDELRWGEAASDEVFIILPAGWQLPGSPPSLAAALGDPPALGALSGLRRQFWVLALGVLLLTVLLSPVLARALARPFTRLVEATESIGRGERELTLPRTGPRELVELGDSLTRMARSLDEAELRMRAAERRGAWREIAQRIAHEIKNALSPLALAVDNVETALAHQGPRAEASIRTSLDTARDQLQSLDRLVTEFRSFARVPQLVVGPIDARDVCAAAVEAATEVHRDTPIELESGESLPALRGDGEQLRRAVSNLVLNAAEAAPGRPVLVRYGGGPGPDRWWILVRDEGPGLSEEQRSRMGEPYFTTKPQGTGLGLAVVLQIVQAHGGELRWEQREEGGLDVRLSLPTRPEGNLP